MAREFFERNAKLVGILQIGEEISRIATGNRRTHCLSFYRSKKELVKGKNKTELAQVLGISRSTLYYKPKKDERDWQLKRQIEEVLRMPGKHSYGSRRIAIHLGVNRKKAQRVMRRFGIKPYRRRRRKWFKSKVKKSIYANLLPTIMPAYPHHVWAADFTELSFKDRTVYVATVVDLYTREVVGIAVSLRKGAQLVLQALFHAIFSYPRPEIFHSDNGKDYDAKTYTETLRDFGIRISRSHPGCPWENGYQESFYDKFKLDLGDPNRFHSLGELVAEIYHTIWNYNNTRIHSALKMPPRMFAKRFSLDKIEM